MRNDVADLDRAAGVLSNATMLLKDMMRDYPEGTTRSATELAYLYVDKGIRLLKQEADELYRWGEEE
jgi:hypothetical protein